MDAINGNGITVGVPVFNGEKYIFKALESILAQSIQPEYIIIADNNSTDETKNICEAFSNKYSHIRYIRHEQNIGLTENFYYILSEAKTQYFVFLCADDFWSVNFLESLSGDYINNKQIVSSYPGVINIDENDCEIGRRNDFLNTIGFEVNDVASGIALEISGDWLYSLNKKDPYLKSYSRALNYSSRQKWSGYTRILFEGHIIPVLMSEYGAFYKNENYLLYKRNHNESSDKRDNIKKINISDLFKYYNGFIFLMPNSVNGMYKLRYVLKSLDQTLNVAHHYYKGSYIEWVLIKILRKIVKYLVKNFLQSNLIFLK